MSSRSNPFSSLKHTKVHSHVRQLPNAASLYGHLPAMAKVTCGNKPASSFCERVNSAAKLIMTDGRTLLPQEELEMCTVLRINRKFMIHMKEHYAHVVLCD